MIPCLHYDSMPTLHPNHLCCIISTRLEQKVPNSPVLAWLTRRLHSRTKPNGSKSGITKEELCELIVDCVSARGKSAFQKSEMNTPTTENSPPGAIPQNPPPSYPRPYLEKSTPLGHRSILNLRHSRYLPVQLQPLSKTLTNLLSTPSQTLPRGGGG